MFQDSAGALPVYAPGQGQVDPPVGLILDKRQPAGQQLVTNGTFADGLTGWAQTTAGYWVVTGGRAYHALSSAYNELRAVVPTTAGYVIVEFDYEVLSAAATTQFFFVNAVGTTVSGASTRLPSGSGRMRYISTQGIQRIGFSRVSGTMAEFYISNVSVKAVPGNHAYQTTTTSRPTLSARYNALSASERFDDAYWGFTSNYAVEKTGDVQDPSGGSNAWKITSTTGSAALNKVVGAGFKNPVYTVILRAGSRNPDILVRNATTATNLAGGSVSNPSTSGAYGKFTNADLGGGWRKLTIEITSGVATSDVLIIYLGSTGSVATGQYFYAYRAEFREANDGIGLPEYQRVVDASNYDTTGFPLYLKFDGVDDFLQTASVDFSGTDKVLISAAMRKLSDAAAALAIELSANYSANTGVFAILAPSSAAATTVAFGSKGTASIVATADNFAQAPISVVITGYSEIGNRVQKLRRDGIQKSSSSTDQGVGNYGNYPLYIGRRGGTSNPFNGRLYSLLIRGAATPDATILKVERYLNQKAKVY